jgi:hypothetical protein
MIQSKVLEICRLKTEAFHLIGLDLRKRYERALKENKLPQESKWDQARVLQFLHAVSTSSASVDKDILQTWKELYKPLRETSTLPAKERTNKLNNALKELATHMAASMNTNIQMHFFKRQCKYLRLKHDLNKEDARKLQNELNETLKGCPEDLLTLPEPTEKGVAYDLEKSPEKFLYPMWRMNSWFAEVNAKTFAILPLSTGFTPSASLQIDTETLDHWLSNARTKEYHERQQIRRAKDRALLEKQNAEKRTQDKKTDPKKRTRLHPPGRQEGDEILSEKDFLWNSFFDFQAIHLTESQKKRGIRFGHHITTDGISVSIQLIHIGHKVLKRAKKRKTSKKDCDPNIYASLDHTKVVGVDPGKHAIVHMTTETSPKDSEGLTLEYTAAQRRYESKSSRRNKHLQRVKFARHPEIQQLEALLAQTNSRAPALADFQKYLSTRFSVQEKLYAFYANNIYRIYRWWNWRATRSSEDKFINRIEKVFGKDFILAYGDWSSSIGVKGPSTPTVGLKSRIIQRYGKEHVLGMLL